MEQLDDYIMSQYLMEQLDDYIIKNNSKVKKRWEKPFIDCLDVNKTKSGDFEADEEGSWWIFTWGS